MSVTTRNQRTTKGPHFPVRKPTDEQLLVQYRESGDRDQFAHLVKRYEQELYGYLRRYLGDAQLAEDVFQQTFLQVHLKCEQFTEGRKFRPWLYTIATNQAIDSIRRNKRHQAVSLDRSSGSDEDLGTLVDLLISNEPDPHHLIDVEERRLWVRQAIGELSENLRTVLLLVYFQGMKYREAADTLGLPVGTVKSRMHLAILKLSESWNASHHEVKTTNHA